MVLKVGAVLPTGGYLAMIFLVVLMGWGWGRLLKASSGQRLEMRLIIL